MNSLAFATIEDIQKRLQNREISYQEIVDHFLRRFAQYDPDLKSALEVFSAESVLKKHIPGGDLDGIPGLIKDNISQEGRRLACASKILEGYTASYDATAITRLKSQGSLLLGRANMDEFAMGSSTETSAFQKTANPWDATRVPGGSSGGSAAAVAAGLVPYALGSDTGGSVRQPAGFCGIVGMKPTYGLVSRYGLVAYASSLDQIGVFTRTIRDNALVLSAIAGHDAHDSSTLFVEKQDYAQRLDGSLKEGLRIGVIDNALNAQGVDPEVHAAVESAIALLEKSGATISRVTLPTFDYSAAAYFIISRAEAASNLARFDGIRYGLRKKDAENLNALYSETRHDGFGAEVASRIMVGNYVLAIGHADEFYDNAKKVQRLIRREFMDTFEDVDLLICPVQPAPAFKFGAFDENKLQMDLQDYFTAPVNLAGIPALALQCGMSKDQLPIGFQIIGPPLSEELMYRTAYVYEQQTAWHTMHPEKFCE